MIKYLQFCFVHQMDYGTNIKLKKIVALCRLPREAHLNPKSYDTWNMPHHINEGWISWSKIRRFESEVNLISVPQRPGDYDIMIDPLEILSKFNIDLR